MPDYLTGDSRILELFIDAAWMPIGCLTDNSFSEEVQTIGTTTRNSSSWKTNLVTRQSYNISFTGIESDDVTKVLSSQLKTLKRDRTLVTWRINSDTGTGYITSIGETAPAGDLITFNGQITGYGKTPAYGPELVVNGGFDTDTDWAKGSNWTIASGVASYSAVNSGQSMFNQTGGQVEIGKTYRLAFDISGGTARIFWNTGSGSMWVFPNSRTNYPEGSYDIVVESIVNNVLEFFAYNDAGGQAFSIDNVSLKEVL